MMYIVNTITKTLVTTNNYSYALAVFRSATNNHSYVELKATKDDCRYASLRIYCK